ncbi:MAG TPA: DNA polymerase III subunit beta [Membranihabitans sp.]|nr:DNA polymerase III subunit beta [Membranihabitans sp.]
MKFSVSASEFLKKTVIASGVIPSNPMMPILEDFLLELNGNELKLTVSDLETTIYSTLQVQGSEDGKIAVRGKILSDTLKAIPDQPVQFIKEEESNILNILTSNGEYKLACDDYEEFPEIPDTHTSQSVEIPIKTMKAGIDNTLFATSNDEMRQAMMGVFIKVDENNVTFVATDAHKMVKYTFLDVSSEIEGTMIIPKKSLSLVNMALDGTGNVTLNYSKSHVFIQSGNTEIACRLIDATFPNYNGVIPTNNPNILTIDRKALLNSLKRISIYANKSTNQIVLDLKKDIIEIQAQDLDYSNEAHESLSCQYSGDEMQIAYNSKFLIEMLNVLTSDEVMLEMSTPNRASLLLPSSSAENEDLLMLVMPVMVK